MIDTYQGHMEKGGQSVNQLGMSRKSTTKALAAMTPKQQRFSQEVASGRSLSDAYRVAYRAENMQPNSVHREAHRLMNNPKIATRVNELVTEADQEVISQRVATREEVLAAISAFMVVGEPKDSVKLRAAEILGKHYGLFTERVAVEEPRRTAAEIEQELIELLENYDITYNGRKKK